MSLFAFLAIKFLDGGHCSAEDIIWGRRLIQHGTGDNLFVVTNRMLTEPKRIPCLSDFFETKEIAKEYLFV